MNTAHEFLAISDKIMKKRGETYDSEDERSMGSTIKAFNAVTGSNLTESDGWLILLLLKQVRQWSADGYHQDSAIDSVAYAALLSESLSNETEESNQNSERE